jgi:hypothetical protein
MFKVKAKRETIYPNISAKELREIARTNKNFKVVQVPAYDGWRYALYDKKYNYRANVQKRAGVLQTTT